MSSNYHPSMDDPNVWVTYRYYPSLAAAIVAVTFFAIPTFLHFVLIVRHRTWYFIPFFIGGIFEIVGYIGRIMSSNDLWALGPYITQSILLLIAPALFAASIYMTLSRIILLVQGETCCVLPRRWLTAIFVGGDVVAFLLQAGGGGYQAAGTLQALNAGNNIIIAGLFAQLVFFGIFVLVATRFHVRFYRKTRHSNLLVPGGSLWQQQITSLYICSGLIFVRSIFRVIEYLTGNDGYILRHEVFLYIFDGLLMFVVMLIFLWRHPSRIASLLSQQSKRIVSSGTSEYMLGDVHS